MPPPPLPLSSSSELEECPPTHLIIVCCHAIWLGGLTDGEDQNEWAIAPFQEGETPTFIGHIKTGLDLFERDNNSILVFSGAATKKHVTRLSEGESYQALANILRPTISTSPRVFTDDLATDSFQNLLFPLLLFCNHAARPPLRITIVSHAFKRRRFLEQHSRTLCLPREMMFYKGIDPDKGEVGKIDFINGEEFARIQWDEDWWGWGDLLREKRLRRGWDLGAVKFEGWMRRIVSWDGGIDRKEGFPEPLPWASLEHSSNKGS